MFKTCGEFNIKIVVTVFSDVPILNYNFCLTVIARQCRI